MNNPRPMRFDAVAADLFAKMIESAEFLRIWKRIAAERERAVNACLREDDAIKLRRAQGAVAALTAVLGVPSQIALDLKTPKTP